MPEKLKPVGDEAVHEAFEVDISKLKEGHKILSLQISENTALTKQAIAETQKLTDVINALTMLVKVAKFVSAIAIAVSSLWGLAVLIATTNTGPR